NNKIEDLPKDPLACDTLNRSFATHIAPIFDKNGCLNCHSTQVATNGIILDDYAEVVKNTPLIIPSLTWPNSIPAGKKMPPGGPQIPRCEIDQFIAWVNQGQQP
ncbi:MAG: hypothetical protein LPK45_08010, partial [Bacteroidota bacterium]|nr:hypothetical protein [Bacteroidota bacterium]MDX5431015.1 hypothetical protein [Bacteroidota bacterium]MDX5469766.1 hypothetical protein [Bacteroidota bacterium]